MQYIVLFRRAGEIQFPRCCPRCGTSDVTEQLVLPSAGYFAGSRFRKVRAWTCAECGSKYRRATARLRRARIVAFSLFVLTGALLSYVAATTTRDAAAQMVIVCAPTFLGYMLFFSLEKRFLGELNSTVVQSPRIFFLHYVYASRKDYAERLIAENSELNAEKSYDW